MSKENLAEANVNESSSDSETEPENQMIMTRAEAIQQLAIEVKNNQHGEIEKVRMYAMLSYLRLIERGKRKVEASVIVAEAAGKGRYRARAIRTWTNNYMKSGSIPISLQGKHVKTWSFLWDDDILVQIKSFLRSEKWDINPEALASHVNEEILSTLGFDPPPTISVRTARRWLDEFGFKYSEVKKGLYMDGHERADVVAYREEFLKRMALFEKQMPTFSGDDMEIETWPPSGQPVILVTHDECVFSAYDGRRRLWLLEGEQPLRKKGQGGSIHVSDFLTDVGGRLALRDEDKVRVG